MKSVSESFTKPPRPVKVLQYGEGNFLRAFADWMIDVAAEKGVFDGSVMIAKPIEYGNLETFNEQDSVYTVLLRGKKDGQTVSESRVVTSAAGAVDCYVQYEKYAALAGSPDLRFVISNTTEAGIVYDEADRLELTPPKSFPGKLTKFLYERWLAFHGDSEKGLIILPVELIENNGGKLKECCEKICESWRLPAEFITWLNEHNIFCQTLVDRIVTGYPKDEAAALEAGFGYADKLLVTGEPFALWVIESDRLDTVRKEFPLDTAGLPVVFTDDLRPYRERKVRLLNGAHTSTVPAALLAGIETVGEMMADKDFRALLEQNVYGELAPFVPLPADEVNAFAASVLERFENPFIRHELKSIALNSVSKWRARVLPTVKETISKTGKVPRSLAFSLAALAALYTGGDMRDDASVLEFFKDNGSLPAEELAAALLGRADFWGEDLNALPGLKDEVKNWLTAIQKDGARGAVRTLLAGGRVAGDDARLSEAVSADSPAIADSL